jgi:threonine/homoserine/homoserine lactone efflux protein
MTSLGLLLLSTVSISLSGVLMPGPVFAVTVARGRRSPWAGVLVALGHGLIEFPLMALVVWGLASFFQHPTVQLVIGLVGGAVLVWMGYGMLRARPTEESARAERRSGAILSGLVTTAASPYFFLWWGTVGVLLLSRALPLGWAALLLVALTHWLCDLGWYALVSFATFRSRRLWTPRLHRLVFGTCGLLLIGFGVYFAVSTIVQAAWAPFS